MVARKLSRRALSSGKSSGITAWSKLIWAILSDSRTLISFSNKWLFVFLIVFVVFWMLLILWSLCSSLVVIGNLRGRAECKKKYANWLWFNGPGGLLRNWYWLACWTLSLTNEIWKLSWTFEDNCRCPKRFFFSFLYRRRLF